MRTPTQCADEARDLIAGYGGNRSLGGAFSEVMSDLAHLATEMGFDFAEEAERALTNAKRERSEGGLLPTAYRGSLALTGEQALRERGADLAHGTRNLEGRIDGRLIHRCIDKKSGRWVDVTPGRQYAPHQIVGEGQP